MAAHAFISYCRRNRVDVARWVQRLQDAGVTVWIDERGIDGACLWTEEITHATQQCKLVVLMLSESAAASINVGREISLACEENKPILPLLLEPVELPASLRYLLSGVQ